MSVDNISARPPSVATKLRRTLDDPASFLLLPGVYDGFSARIALEVGFDGLYMTGAGSTASILGHADLGLLTQTQMRAHAEMIASLAAMPIYENSPLPLIADADTGYGGPIMVARTVQQYAQSGVAGLHIEDQIQTKRCGHLAGKELVDTETFVSRIRAAVQARQRIGSDIVIIARTDSLQSSGYDEAIARLKAAREVGADVAFLEGMTTKEQARKVVEDLAPMPCLLNMVESGATPSMTADEIKALGFKIMIIPFAAMAPAYTAIKAEMEGLKRTGSLSLGSKTISPQDVFRLCGVEDSIAIDTEAGGKSFEKGID
ncbi:methylisocitrate lyase [[Emmonsia] crescens]|uniref:Methylisocitrate lyase n=1 Tax=[Emmonsia] crescens TaxID=73230 RepID=A0A0G2J7N8_9EURO|nr:methylisocitrate lyase [Emmonsia crescens UAMH 3008]